MPRGLGEFEQLILLALVTLDQQEAYGVPIRDLIEQRTGRRVASGAVYTALERLSRRGLVSSRMGEPTAERGGRRKRLYRLETAGERELARSVRALADMSRGALGGLDLGLAPQGAARPKRR